MRRAGSRAQVQGLTSPWGTGNAPISEGREVEPVAAGAGAGKFGGEGRGGSSLIVLSFSVSFQAK